MLCVIRGFIIALLKTGEQTLPLRSWVWTEPDFPTKCDAIGHNITVALYFDCDNTLDYDFDKCFKIFSGLNMKRGQKIKLF